MAGDLGAWATPPLFGMCFSFTLMGSLVVQVYHYYCAFPNDRRFIKVVVYTVLLLDIAQTALSFYAACKYFGSGFGNFTLLSDDSFFWLPAAILPSFIATIVQSFYAYRLYTFSGSMLAGGVILVLAFIQLGSGIAQGIVAKSIPLTDMLRRPLTMIALLNSCAVTIGGRDDHPDPPPTLQDIAAMSAVPTLTTSGVTGSGVEQSLSASAADIVRRTSVVPEDKDSRALNVV
ncbi:hypothetical protein FB45DRAFT_1041397 [Roridomyces roridus]|uniref:Uncharacterized protein n=1 Tax=Roridomyces roridus TaxID=1738132 RepID=A0AAD7F9V2_9AGAR|nr:hypothetical protein FB45DRAFT_1041397 [Roridomyces roridus]